MSVCAHNPPFFDHRLHVIIFDEIDALCKRRGSTPNGTGVNDSVVNQLLSKIDGVNSLNNILIIGMTNRLDLLDVSASVSVCETEQL